MAKYEVVSFLSDLGTVDESVGVCKAIIYRQAPDVNIFDITHNIPQFDVRAGALALTRAIQFLPNGVVVAAVDPGSPKNQRYIAVEMENGVLVGPDNGILAPAAQLIGEPKRIVEISNPEYRIEAPGGVFAARDILAPAAGVIAGGTDLAELGKIIPMEELVPGMLQLSRYDQGGAFLGEIWSIDRFGNIQMNITPEELATSNVNLGDSVVVRINGNDTMAKYVERYADLAIGQLGLLVDSTGMISIVKNLDFAARDLDAKDGKEVIILPQGTTVTGVDVDVETYTKRDELLVNAQEAAMADLNDNIMGSVAPQHTQAPQGIVPGAPMDPSVSAVAQPLTPADPFASSPVIPVAPPVAPTPPVAPAQPPVAPAMPPAQPPVAPAMPPAQPPVAPAMPPAQPPVAPAMPPAQPGMPVGEQRDYVPAPGNDPFVQPAQPPTSQIPGVPEQPLGQPVSSDPFVRPAQPVQPPADQAQGVPPKGLPVNVFDLFQGDEESEETQPES